MFHVNKGYSLQPVHSELAISVQCGQPLHGHMLTATFIFMHCLNVSFLLQAFDFSFIFISVEIL